MIKCNLTDEDHHSQDKRYISIYACLNRDSWRHTAQAMNYVISCGSFHVEPEIMTRYSMGLLGIKLCREGTSYVATLLQ